MGASSITEEHKGKRFEGAFEFLLHNQKEGNGFRSFEPPPPEARTPEPDSLGTTRQEGIEPRGRDAAENHERPAKKRTDKTGTQQTTRQHCHHIH
ncbi:hypothetical protein HNY73_011748 [Argiope bruennichi]|uniref:Uncharacterized protein n=1 Tax=Argiope bruennichi TaxID=94029 RepID=A0A8T0EUC3_ARGBR|nr:hypothetical protein HNY73_011748 [Argiope bruennichi]